MSSGTLRALGARWKVIAHRIGDAQARMLLSIFYFAVLGPFALVVRAFPGQLAPAAAAAGGFAPRPGLGADPAAWARRQV
jgi:hypothetical protein